MISVQQYGSCRLSCAGYSNFAKCTKHLDLYVEELYENNMHSTGIGREYSQFDAMWNLNILIQQQLELLKNLGKIELETSKI